MAYTQKKNPYLSHGWGDTPEQKRKEQEYNKRYYELHKKDKWGVGVGNKTYRQARASSGMAANEMAKAGYSKIQINQKLNPNMARNRANQMALDQQARMNASNERYQAKKRADMAADRLSRHNKRLQEAETERNRAADQNRREQETYKRSQQEEIRRNQEADALRRSRATTDKHRQYEAQKYVDDYNAKKKTDISTKQGQLDREMRDANVKATTLRDQVKKAGLPNDPFATLNQNAPNNQARNLIDSANQAAKDASAATKASKDFHSQVINGQYTYDSNPEITAEKQRSQEYARATQQLTKLFNEEDSLRKKVAAAQEQYDRLDKERSDYLKKNAKKNGLLSSSDYDSQEYQSVKNAMEKAQQYLNKLKNEQRTLNEKIRNMKDYRSQLEK